MITSQPTPRPSDPGLGAEEGRARMTAVRTTNLPPTPALSTRTSWPKTILKNTIIAPQPPPRVTASSRGRSMQGNSSVYFYTIIFFILDTNILRNSAAPRSSRAFSVYVDDDREKPSISRFSAAPESRSYRLVAPGVGLLSTCPLSRLPWFCINSGHRVWQCYKYEYYFDFILLCAVKHILHIQWLQCEVVYTPLPKY